MTYQSTVLADSPLYYYRLGESASPVTNSGSAGGTATVGAGTTFLEPPAGTIDGNSIYFSNTTSTGTLSSGSFTSTTTWSMECWVKRNTAYTNSTLRRLMYQGGSSASYNRILIDLTTGQIRVEDSTNGFTTGKTVAAINDGNWHHIVITHSGSTVTYYVDGTSRGTDTLTMAGKTGTFVVSAPNTSESLAAWVDEPAYYSTALTTTQVSNHYAAGTASADTTAPTVPGSVTATANSATQITVAWAASTDATGVASYRVRRGGVDITGATAVTGLSFVDTGLTTGTLYSYTVSAVDAAGNRSAESTAATATTWNNKLVQPPAMTASTTSPVPVVTATTVINKTVQPPAATATLSAPTPVVKSIHPVTADTSSSLGGSNANLYLASNNFALIKVDSLPVVAAGKQISVATLNLYVTEAGSFARFYRVTSDWTEATDPTTVTHSTSFLTQSLDLGWNSIDVTNLVNLWTNGTFSNYGIALDTTGGDISVASRESSNKPYITATVADIPAGPEQRMTPPAITATLTMPQHRFGTGTSNVAPVATLALNSIAPAITVTASITAVSPAITASAVFAGGISKNPDYRANAGVAVLNLSARNASQYVSYPIIMYPPAMGLTLTATGGNTVNLTTNRLSKLFNAMTLTVKVVGIYMQDADRYLQQVPLTIDQDDIWYKLDETSGQIAHDSSVSESGTAWVQNGYLHSGADNPAPILGVDGPYLRKAVHFDGVKNYLLVGPYNTTNQYQTGQNDIYPNSSITVEFSIKTSQANGVVFSGAGAGVHSDISNSSFDYPYAGGEVRLVNGEMVIKNRAGETVRVRKNIADGQWHHIVISIPNQDSTDAHKAGVIGGGELLSDDFNPAFVMVDGRPILVRYNLFASSTTNLELIPLSFMAKTNFSSGYTITGTSDFLAGDLRDVIVRTNKAINQTTAQKLYYEWSDSLITQATAISLDLSTRDPFKARGNSKKMLMVYGLPWTYDNSRFPLFTYMGNLSGVVIQSFAGAIQTSTGQRGGEYWPHAAKVGGVGGGSGVEYYEPKPFALEDYMVFPVSIRGDFANHRFGPTSAAGVLSSDTTRDWQGQLVDDATGLPRFLNLQEDLSEPVTNYDVLTVVNYPWATPEDTGQVTNQTSSNKFDPAIPSIGMQGAGLIQPRMGLNDNEWTQARDAFRDSIMEASYDGVNLWIPEHHMALHLGFVQSVDVHWAGWFRASSEISTNAPGNKEAERIDREHFLAANPTNTYNWVNVLGDYHEYPQTNRYRRIVATESGLTDIPGNEWGQMIERFAYDAYLPNGSALAYDVLRRPNGLQVGDLSKMSMMDLDSMWAGSDIVHPNSSDQRRRTEIISAKPDGVAGKIIAREQEKFWGSGGVEIVNAYKDNAVTIAAERGTVVRGRPIRGRAFIDFMDTDIYATHIATDKNKNRWGGNLQPAPTTTWDFDTRRNRELKLEFVVNKLKFNNDTGQFENINVTTRLFDYEFGEYIYVPYYSMHIRGLNWLGEVSDLPAGAVKVYAPGMSLNVTMPKPGFSRTRNLNLPVTGAMRLDVELRQPKNYRDGQVSEKALPMVLNLDMRGIGKTIKITGTITLSLVSIAPLRAVGAGDKITVYLDGDRNLKVFLKEDN